MKFIDLFAGLGGFHTGLAAHGHECVFSCELDTKLQQLYKNNYGIEPAGDIKKVDEKNIPPHDILCAGFPCQPFSLAGKKKGAKCPESGKLIDDVIRIAKYHSPKFILLENVPNILTIEDGKFWEYIQNEFSNINYTLDYKIISPVDLGIPQNRKRVFILGIRNDLVSNSSFTWPDFIDLKKCNLNEIIDSTLEHKKLEDKKIHLLDYWQQFLNNINLPVLGSVSITAPEFGADYPLDFSELSIEEMRKFKGAYGVSLIACKTWDEIYSLLPSYSRKNKSVSEWILKSVNFTRALYKNNKNYCDHWKTNLDKNNNSWQILEWRGERNDFNINNHIVQFRASGIRIIKSDIAPSLIAMTPTQIPIIPSQSRYISVHEAAKLQYLHKLKFLPEKTNEAFKALGNAVNAKIVELITKNLNQKVLS